MSALDDVLAFLACLAAEAEAYKYFKQSTAAGWTTDEHTTPKLEGFHPTSKHDGKLRAFLWAHGLLSILFIWGRIAADGTLTLLQEATASKSYQLSGSETALAQSFVGVPFVDQSLRSLIILFWGAVDGSSPATTAAAIYFAGQIYPMATAMYLDGLRAGNGPGVVKVSLWFELIGLAAIGCVGSLWGALYTASSPTTAPAVTRDGLRAASLVAEPRTAALLLPAMLASYVGPLLLMASPSAPAVQWAIVAWNLFPVGIVVIVKAGSALLNTLFPLGQTSAVSPQQGKATATATARSLQQAHMSVVRWLGVTSVAFGLAVHVAVGAVSLSSVVFPGLFRDEHTRALHPWTLFVPPLALKEASVVSDGLLGFIKWDQAFGYSVVIVVYLAQLRNAAAQASGMGGYSWLRLVILSALSCLLIGPGTTIMAISWLRDEVLYSS
ncbi:hypothetical protein KVR01_005836 [Diaporthe batatas]|uniref:uncharacterized protein n=1 Tax=Diaporthe batatas TaxID=748121 RepID=UPI001D059428|nr:uncharacterized protein KVR01_005836 [Diaporthe batatas]KAG8163918.1 hypothetical protein KVR01_005836 [Diaporthe batatas]